MPFFFNDENLKKNGQFSKIIEKCSVCESSEHGNLLIWQSLSFGADLYDIVTAASIKNKQSSNVISGNWNSRIPFTLQQ